MSSSGKSDRSEARDPRPLVCHVVHRFDYGGLENGVVNLINYLPPQRFRHAVVALTEASDFSRRIRHTDVRVCALGKKPGRDLAAYAGLYRWFRRHRPTIVHTRNVGTIDCAAVATAARVPVRIHGEHGWDVHDPDGTSRKYLAMRRLYGAFVNEFVAVSEELRNWLVTRVGVSERKVRHICNGVDTDRFVARAADRAVLPANTFPPHCVVVGSVTRFSEIKDPLNLVHAFALAVPRLAGAGIDLRLVMAGDGALRAAALTELGAAGLSDRAWLPGSRDDVASLLSAIDVYALGSRREGISNTVLEAMAAGRPVVASATGGNLELVAPGVTGELVPPGNPAALAAAIERYARDPERRATHGAAARERAVERYSLARMLAEYLALYQDCTRRAGGVR